MPHYADLTPYVYLPEPSDLPAQNVGWLADGHPFPTGPVPAGFADRLARLALREPVHRTRGWQECEFCDVEYPTEVHVDGERQPVGDAEIRVTGVGGSRYAAPTLIVHYVVAHGYRPPDEFVDAVMADDRAAADRPPYGP
jgi:hypothetical protein